MHHRTASATLGPEPWVVTKYKHSGQEFAGIRESWASSRDKTRQAKKSREGNKEIQRPGGAEKTHGGLDFSPQRAKSRFFIPSVTHLAQRRGRTFSGRRDRRRPRTVVIVRPVMERIFVMCFAN